MQNQTVSTPYGRYGIGWSVEDSRYGFRSVLAQGGTDADQAWVRLLPSEGIAVVLLSNIGSTPGERIVDEILSAMLPAYAENRATGTPPAAASKPAIRVAPSGALIATWTGAISTDHGDEPLSLTIGASGDVHSKLRTQPPAVVNQVRFREGHMSGVVTADLQVPGATAVKLYLELRDGALKGAAVTDPSPQLPYWVELKKVQQTVGDLPNP